MTTVLVQASSDTYSIQGSTYPNAGTAQHLTVTGSGGGAQRLAFLYFNRPFPLGASIVTATLFLYQKGAATGGARELQVNRVAAKWTEAGLRDSNKPTVTGTPVNTVSQGNGGADGRVWEFDVTQHMQAVSDGADWFGFRVGSTNATMLTLFSSEADEFQPTLVVEWSDAPEQPAFLSPSGGRAVSIPRPLLRTEFVDHGGDTTLASIRVQMNEDEPSETPSFDSGNVPAVDPEWLPTFDIADGETWFWRALLTDGAGLDSEWSDWAAFTRTPKPVVSIVNPTGGVVNDPTPLIIWSVTGTQVHYQVFITDPADMSQVLWSTGKRTSGETSVTLADAVLNPGQSYGLTVRVWDDVSRESIPGDPPYVDTAITFTFELSSTVAPVEGFTVTADPESPAATLTWTRAGAPDSYTIVRDGVVVATGIPPTDTITTGTSNAWSDPASPPRVEHVWEVLAVENGEASGGNPTATATTRPIGVWLCTTIGEPLAVCLAGDGDNPAAPTSGPNEVSAVHYPIGAESPVVMTQSVRLRQGESEGWLGPAPLDELMQIKSDWLSIIARRSEPLALIASDASMRVFIYNTWTGLLDEFADYNARSIIPVSFSYAQTKG